MKFYKMPEAAKLLRMSVPTLQKYVMAGSIHSVKIGRSRLIPESAIEEVAKHGVKSLPPTEAQRESLKMLRERTERLKNPASIGDVLDAAKKERGEK